MSDIKTRVALKSVVSEKGLYNNDGSVTAVFLVGHNNGVSTLTQDLVLSWTPEGWEAVMNMDEVRPLKTSTASAWKLAECMERMAAAIKAAEFDSFNLNGL